MDWQSLWLPGRQVSPEGGRPCPLSDSEIVNGQNQARTEARPPVSLPPLCTFPCHTYNARMDQRNEYNVPVRYEGPPPRPPRPWFLHPAFIVCAVLLLLGGGFMMKDRIRIMRLRSRGLNVEMVDGKPVIGLPEKATLIGDAWQWREFDNSVLGEGLSISDIAFSSKRKDIDGDGFADIMFESENGAMFLSPDGQWVVRPLGINARRVSQSSWMSNTAWWDYDGDGTLDLVLEEDSDDYEYGDACYQDIFDGKTGERMKRIQSEFMSDMEVADFNGNGSLELVLSAPVSRNSGRSVMVLASGGMKLGSFDLDGLLFEFNCMDTDGDGKSELVYKSSDNELRSVGLGRPDSVLFDNPDRLDIGPLVSSTVGGSRIVLVGSMFSSMFDISAYDFSEGEFDEQQMQERMDKIEKDAVEMERLLGGSIETDYEDPDYPRRQYAHFQSLSSADRRKLSSRVAILDPANGHIVDVQFPAEYLRNNIPMFIGPELTTLRLPGTQGESVLLMNFSGAGLLVMDASGAFVHYEELGDIPQGSAVLGSPEGDHLVLFFRDRILVYP